MADTHTYTKSEEISNAITHGIGFLLSIAALVLLIVNAATKGTAIHVVSYTIYGSTMLLLYLSSTLVHSFPKGKVKDLFEIFDHSAIYLFIAGSYMPFFLTVVKGALGWTLFGVVWGIAIAGVVFKIFFVKKFLFTSTIIYVVLGWMAIFAWKSLVINLEFNSLVLLIVGGSLYTLGTVFYIWKLFAHSHAVWHLFVLAGSVVHFFCVLSILN
jgi:hemolysin III